MKKLIIYISGPISGLPPEQAKQKFIAAQDYLERRGYDVVNPMELEHNHDKSWDSYMREDLKALLGCNAIYMLEGWQKSRGANIELNLSVSMEYVVYYEGEEV